MHTIHFPEFLKASSFLGGQVEGVELAGSCLRPDLLLSTKHIKLGLRWIDFEVEPGKYVLDSATAYNLSLIGNVPRYINFHTCPPWYQLWPGNQGSPPRPEFYPQMGKAVVAAMKLTGAKYAEILREPNVRISALPNDVQWYYGAIVSPTESFYDGGVRYGKLLKEVRKIVRSSILGGDIFAGSLLVGWVYPDIIIEPHLKDFMAGVMSVNTTIIRGIKIPRFPAKIATIHPYLTYYQVMNNNNIPFIDVANLAKWLKNVAGVPVLFSEVSLLRSDDLDDPLFFRERQKDYIPVLRSLVSNNTIAGWTWYNNDSVWPWKHCSLIRGAQRGDPNLQPTPAYYEWSK